MIPKCRTGSDRLDNNDCRMTEGIMTTIEKENFNMMDPKDMALELAKALDSKKGEDIEVLKTGELTTLAEYFVICTASSTTQIKALADMCEKVMKDQGEPPHHVEGHRGGTWMLLDFSAVVVHIFNDEARKFYDLERLWKDAEKMDLSDVLLPN